MTLRHVLPAANAHRAVSSIATRARRDVVEPISLHRFVSPEIHRYFHESGLPCELLLELELEPVFLLPGGGADSRSVRTSSRSATHRPTGPRSIFAPSLAAASLKIGPP